MDEVLARIMVIAIAAIGAVAWLAAVSVMLRLTREQRTRAVEGTQTFDIESTSGPGAIVGTAEVAGRPEELSAKLAERLARDGVGPLGPVKIMACNGRELEFESARPDNAAKGYHALGFRRGRVQFAGIGARTTVDYVLETTSRGILLGMGWLFIALGLAALIAAVWLQFTYVIPSPNPGIRFQAVQTVQIVHFLWPPFLFAFLSRQPARILRAQMDALVHNLPYA
jgi:hypothetical protein